MLQQSWGENEIETRACEGKNEPADADSGRLKRSEVKSKPLHCTVFTNVLEVMHSNMTGNNRER